jgi:hypothetical protein
LKTTEVASMLLPAGASADRTGAHAPNWLRALEQAQWAALGEHLDRSSPSSAIEERPEETAGRADRDRTDALARAVKGAASRCEDMAALQAAGAMAPSTSPTAAARELGHAVLNSGSATIESVGESTALASPADANPPLQEADGCGISPARDLAGRAGRSLELRQSGASTPPRTTEPYSARSLRVFKSGNDAQVFIRDAGVDQTALGMLVARLEQQLGAAGTRLATLTVNGRVVYAAAATDSESTTEPKEVTGGD